MTTNFNDFKSGFSGKCKKASACQPEFKKVLAAENFDELLSIIKNNILWCINEKIIDCQYLETIGDEILLKNGIYTKGEHSLDLSGNEICHVLLFGTSKLNAKSREAAR